MISNKCKRLYVHDTIDDIEHFTKRLKVTDNKVKHNKSKDQISQIYNDLQKYMKINTKTFETINKTLIKINTKIDILDKKVTKLNELVNNNTIDNTIDTTIDHTSVYIS